MKKLSRRYIYEETEKEVMDWVNDPVTQQMLDKPPIGRAGFPFYLEQYISHLKFKARQQLWRKKNG